MIDFRISDEIRETVNSLYRFIDTVVVPLEKENKELLEDERLRYDNKGKYVPKVLELRKQVRLKSAEAGFYTMFGAEELGGSNLGAIATVIIFESIYKKYGVGRVLIDDVIIPSPFSNGLTPVLLGLTPSLRDKVLDEIVAGEKTLCFGLTEPDAGSDPLNMKSTAEKKGDKWILNGTKQFITNGAYADYCMFFAVTDKEAKASRKGGVTGFFVDTKSPGFKVDSVLPIMGHLGGEAAIISLDNVEVPEENVLGKLNEGLKNAMNGVNKGRLGLASKCIGVAEWALEQGVFYANLRKTFGKLIGEYQMIQNMLAESAMDIYAAKNMALNCAWKIENQESNPIKETSMVKAFCTEMVSRVTDRVIQIHGGMGVTNELKLEGAYRWARWTRIPDGTSEIHRRTIAKCLLKGDLTI